MEKIRELSDDDAKGEEVINLVSESEDSEETCPKEGTRKRRREERGGEDL